MNVGAQEIVRTFLGNPKSYPRVDVITLQDALRQFLAICSAGLTVNERYVPPASAFRKELRDGFEQLSKFFEPFLQPPPDSEEFIF